MSVRRSSITGLVAPALVGAMAGSLFFLVFFQQGLELQRVTASEAALLDVYRALKFDYIEQIEESELANRAIDGMFNGLDNQSEYFTGEAVSDIHSYASSRFGGIGIEAAMVGGVLWIQSTIAGKPADRAGMLSGDRITAIDETPIEGRTQRDVFDDLRGPVGSAVGLTLKKRVTGETVQVKLVRAEITNNSVEFSIVEPGIAVLHISEFLDNTADLVHDRLEAASELTGMVIDLRGNPGGLLEVALRVADFFLDSGVIVKLESRDTDNPRSYLATPGELLPAVSLAVLIDNGTASAAELLAGALQDHKRAVLLGQPTFGKGTVQSVISIGEDRVIKLTTGRYVLPNGRSVGESGIEPDITILSSNPESSAVAVLKGRIHP